MADKLNPKVVGLSLAAISGMLFVACWALFALFPAGTFNFFNELFHGVDLTKIARIDISSGRTIIGLIEIVIAGFVTGWLFAIIYNYFLRKIKR